MKNQVKYSYEQKLQELRTLPHNKRCFDCATQGTTYVVYNIGIFVCSICAGLQQVFLFSRDFNKVKGISVSSFTEQEISLLEKVGNLKAYSIWMATYNESQMKCPNTTDLKKLKEFLKMKYQDKKWYKPQQEVSSNFVQEEQKKGTSQGQLKQNLKQQEVIKPANSTEVPQKRSKQDLLEMFVDNIPKPVSKSNPKQNTQIQETQQMQ